MPYFGGRWSWNSAQLARALRGGPRGRGRHEQCVRAARLRARVWSRRGRTATVRQNDDDSSNDGRHVTAAQMRARHALLRTLPRYVARAALRSASCAWHAAERGGATRKAKREGVRRHAARGSPPRSAPRARVLSRQSGGRRSCCPRARHGARGGSAGDSAADATTAAVALESPWLRAVCCKQLRRVSLAARSDGSAAKPPRDCGSLATRITRARSSRRALTWQSRPTTAVRR